LISDCSFHVSKIDSQKDYDNEIEQVLHLCNSLREIDVVVSSLPFALSPILCFSSTLVMNFLSYEGVYCLYPKMTLACHGYLDPSHVTADEIHPNALAHMNKYLVQGFSFDVCVGEPRRDGWMHLGAERHTGNEEVLFIPFRPGL
jgi:hypothetical protein